MLVLSAVRGFCDFFSFYRWVGSTWKTVSVPIILKTSSFLKYISYIYYQNCNYAMYIRTPAVASSWSYSTFRCQEFWIRFHFQQFWWSIIVIYFVALVLTVIDTIVSEAIVWFSIALKASFIFAPRYNETNLRNFWWRCYSSSCWFYKLHCYYFHRSTILCGDVLSRTDVVYATAVYLTVTLKDPVVVSKAQQNPRLLR